MAYPSPDQYNDALQAPHLAFDDPVLQAGKVVVNDKGLPQAFGGGFAVTYAVSHGRRKYAVRCFHKEARDLQDRYARIGEALAGGAGGGHFVGFDYQPTGVRVLGKSYPLVKMDWVNGAPLGIWLERNHRRKSALTPLIARLRELERHLRTQGLAHGDLQNGNILVQDGKLRLIDYDGMFAPGLAVGDGNEVGHRHFQHPTRKGEHFGPEMDRFSFIVLDLSLRALVKEPGLFRRHANGENILFSAADYLDPAASRVFSDLRAIRSLAKDVEKFAALCTGPLAEIPTLEDFVGVPPPPPPKPRPVVPNKSPNQLLLEDLQRMPGEALPPDVLLDDAEPQGPIYQPPGTVAGAAPQWLVVAGVAAQLLWLGAKMGGQAAIDVAARQIETLAQDHLPDTPPTPAALAGKALSSLKQAAGRWFGSKRG